MDVDAGVVGEPVADLGLLMGCVVVHDEVEFAAGVGLSDLLEEAQEFLVAVAWLARRGDVAGGDVQGGEQGGGAVAEVVVGGALGQAGAHGKDRGGPVQGLFS